MDQQWARAFVKALGLGAISGLRSMTSPAVLSCEAAYSHEPELQGTAFAPLLSKKTAAALCVMALVELVVDKLPGTPNRTETPSLIFRGLSGALVGSAVFASENRPAGQGAAIGAAAAIAASYGGETLRRTAGQKLSIPDPLVAVVEDTIAVAGSFAILRSAARA